MSDAEILEAFDAVLPGIEINTYFMMGYCGTDNLRAMAKRLAELRARGWLTSERRHYWSEGHNAVYWQITASGREAVKP